MNFYFCESCGARVTDHDLEAGRARNKKLNGVYCSACAAGVLTVELNPSTEKAAPGVRRTTSAISVPVTLPTRRRPTSSGLIPIPGPFPAGKTARPELPHGRGNRTLEVRSGPAAPTRAPGSGYLVPGIVASLTIVVLLAAMLQGASNSAAQKPRAVLARANSGQTGQASRPRGVTPPTLLQQGQPNPIPPPAGSPRPDLGRSGNRPARQVKPEEAAPKAIPAATPPEPMAAAKILPPAAAPQAASQQAAAEVRSPEAKAQDAFEELRQFKGLATEDIAGRVQRVEAYLAEHGEAIVASRARQMLVELKRAARPGVSKDEPQPGGATAEGLAAPAGLPRFNAEQKEVIVRLIASLKGGDVLKLLGNAEKILREQTALPLGMVQEISAGIESIKNWIPKLHKHWESLKGQEATFEGSEGRSMTVEILKVVETAMHVRIVKSSIVKFKEGETWAFEREKLPPKIRAQVFLLFTPSAPEEQLLCAISECSQGRYENGLKILERCPTLKTTEPLREYFSSLLPEPKK